jgi:hypothetical protein
LKVGQFRKIFKPRGQYYELACLSWSWNEPTTDPDLGRLFSPEQLRDNSILIKSKDFKDWEAVAHQSSCMLSHADWFATAIESAENRALSSLTELGQEMLIPEPPETTAHKGCLSPAALYESLEPAVAFLADSKHLISSLAKSVQDCARMQLQLLANMQVARRDLYISQMPKYVPDETLLLLRQAPLGGEFLFGDDVMQAAHVAKAKGEQSTVNTLLIKQATPSGTAKQQPAQSKKQIQQIPLPEGGYAATGRGRGQRGRGRGQNFRSEKFLSESQPPFRGGRGGQSGRGGRGRGRGRGGQRGGYAKQ